MDLERKKALDVKIDQIGSIVFILFFFTVLFAGASMAIFAITGINIEITFIPILAKILAVGFVLLMTSVFVYIVIFDE